MRPNSKYWREAATLIALARKNTMEPFANFEVLVQKRQSNSSFFPNSIVFPGGTTEDCDSGLEWMSLIKSHGITEDKFKTFCSGSFKINPIFDHDSTTRRHISLRITAIRETFEELGVLICKRTNEDNSFATTIADFDVEVWQEKVHKDPEEFMKLCLHLNCYPDIWALHYWSNWLTPVDFKQQRFDTAFFFIGFNEKPQIYIEKNEVSQYKWAQPETMVSEHESKTIHLPPPQLYELLRLKSYNNIEAVMNYAKERSQQGYDLFFPIFFNTKDGRISLLPGDDFYPEQPNRLTETVDVEKEDFYKSKTTEELRKTCKHLHRFEFNGNHTTLIVRNIASEKQMHAETIL